MKNTFLKTAGLGLAVSAAALLSMNAEADFVILDDLIVDGSACIGFDCVNGEVFSFDTLRLKENNLRIKFDDTSTAASFPDTDWQLTANESANGGANKFSIEDISGGRTPFTVEANARSHSLYVDDGGRIGLGTSTPSQRVHTKHGDTPAVRLDQDSSSGFEPQVWDVAGNETNFFIRDSTNGSALPFRIRPGAPTSSLEIAADGKVLFGANDTSSKTIQMRLGSTDFWNTTAASGGAEYKISRSGTGNTEFSLSNTGNLTLTGVTASTLTLEPSGGFFWNATAANGGNEFKISRSGTGQTELSLDQAGNLTVFGSLFSGGGTCGGGCDAVFNPEYDLLSIEEHAELMWENKYLPNVGPTVENAPINVSDKMGRMLNELEKAHIYIDDLNERNKALQARLEKLEVEMAR